MRLFVFLLFVAAYARAAGPSAFHLDYFPTYLGGSLTDQPAGIAVDSIGNAYVVSTTYSPDFPLTSTAFGAPSKNQSCAFVAKLDATATAIFWSVVWRFRPAKGSPVERSGIISYVIAHASSPHVDYKTGGAC